MNTVSKLPLHLQEKLFAEWFLMGADIKDLADRYQVGYHVASGCIDRHWPNRKDIGKRYPKETLKKEAAGEAICGVVSYANRYENIG